MIPTQMIHDLVYHAATDPITIASTVGSVVGGIIGGTIGAARSVRKRWRREASAVARSVATEIVTLHEETCPCHRAAGDPTIGRRACDQALLTLRKGG